MRGTRAKLLSKQATRETDFKKPQGYTVTEYRKQKRIGKELIDYVTGIVRLHVTSKRAIYQKLKRDWIKR